MIPLSVINLTRTHLLQSANSLSWLSDVKKGRSTLSAASLVGASQMLYKVGMNFLESFSCSLHDSWNAAMPAMIEKIISASDIIDQMAPQQCEDPPYFFANTLASELLTLRRMRSSHYSS